MTLPLMALAVGAIVAGFVGIPAALGGGNAIEHFLEPSFTASAVHGAGRGGGRGRAADGREAAGHEAAEAARVAGVELGLMVFSVLIAVVGIWLRLEVLRHAARRSPSGSPTRWAGAHRTAVEQVLRRRALQRDGRSPARWPAAASSGRSIARSSTAPSTAPGWLTLFGAWLSGLTDRTVVDGAVNLVGWIGAGVELLVPAVPDRPRAELRAADAVRRLRVRQRLSVRAMTHADGCAVAQTDYESLPFARSCSRRSPARCCCCS